MIIPNDFLDVWLHCQPGGLFALTILTTQLMVSLNALGLKEILLNVCSVVILTENELNRLTLD